MPRPPATPPLFSEVTPADFARRRKPGRAPTLTPHLPFKGLRKNGFKDRTPEQNASYMRDLFISRLDDQLLPMIEATLRRHGVLDNGLGLRVIQDLQVVLFPEEFLEPEDKPHAGLIPLGGRIKSGTADGLAALAERMRSQAEAERAGRR